MQMASFVEALQSDLEQIAAVGDDAVSAAALELNGQLPEGHVEVRLAGQDPSLVYVEDAPQQAAPAGDDALSVRITLRLPESLKTAVESAAARDGVSVNTWLVRALARAVSGWASRGGKPGNRLQGYARS